MTDPVEQLSTPIVPIGRAIWSPLRRSEPVTIGIPLPAGAAVLESQISLADRHGKPIPVQVRSLDRWPDGSIRWALIDARADSLEDRADGITLHAGRPQEPASNDRLHIVNTKESIRIETGSAAFSFTVGGGFPVSDIVVGTAPAIDIAESGVRVEHASKILSCRISEVQLDDAGPLRASVEIRGTIINAPPDFPLDVFARVEAFAGSATLRIAVTFRNHRRATHAGGLWTLGDEGSLHLDSIVLRLVLLDQIGDLHVAPEWGDALAPAQLPFEIHQESSGGAHWDRSTHCNREGRVRLRYRGYRRRDGDAEHAGSRATPIAVAQTARGSIAIAMPKFWQNFPRAISVDERRIDVGLLARAAEPHELQGGEQKTHVVVVAFAPDTVSDTPLAWVHDPQLIYPSPQWSCESGAVPFLVSAERDRNGGEVALAQAALDDSTGFLSKREAADEYGWRHFGDLLADHESAFAPPGKLLVSHYNNQYDVIACFAMQFLRTGDPRWWELMADLAVHVKDIDIYHTDEDKAAYNGGLFWHTYHYCDAGTSTHRCYPRNGPASGGLSAEHNYNVGLMLHYYMTGDPTSRAEAISLGRWAIAMDDGRLTVFRWLAGGPTGLASESGSATYHGPGRGAANSILACLVAYRLSREEKFQTKVEELMRRCISSADDIDELDLLNVELRWFYTMFLQVLGSYLQDKSARQVYDEGYWYARASLLHYARWMADHERPYLDHPEQLEYPNETWAAQDLRKADVLFMAALYTDGAERETLVRRAHFFRETSVRTLLATPKHRYTRPTVLALTNTVRFSWYESELATVQSRPGLPAWPGQGGASARRSFEPQKVRALRRAVGLAATVGLAVIAGAVYMIAAR